MNRGGSVHGGKVTSAGAETKGNTAAALHAAAGGQSCKAALATAMHVSTTASAPSAWQQEHGDSAVSSSRGKATKNEAALATT